MFLSGPATKALSPPPSPEIDSFYLSGQALTPPPPPLVAESLKQITFVFGSPYVLISNGYYYPLDIKLIQYLVIEQYQSFRLVDFYKALLL